MRKIKATLEMPSGSHELNNVFMTENGVVIDQEEVDTLYGAHVEVCDGDLGCLALWQIGNHGEPDCHIYYNEEEHEKEGDQ